MTLLTEIQTHKVRVVKTLALFICYIAHGLMPGIMGPTMMDLRVTTGSSIDQITHIVTVRAAGFALGSFGSGIWYDKMNILLFIGISTTASGCLVASVPFVSSIYSLLPLFFAMGVVIGFVDASINVFVIHIWGKRNPPFMQALHFCYGVGALVAPLIARPFLLPTTVTSHHLDDAMNTSPSFTADDVQLVYPYLILAGYFFLVSVIFATLWRVSPETPPHPSRVSEAPVETNVSPSQPDEVTTTKNLQTRYQLVVVILITLFMHLVGGLESTFGAFLAPFSVTSDLRLSPQTAALMSSIYWIAFTFCRLATTFYIDYVGLEKNILVNLGFMILSVVIMLPFGQMFEWSLWSGSILMGLGLSPMWASVFGFMEEYFPLTSRVTASCIISACLGNLTVTVLISPFLESYPQMYLIISAAYAISMMVIFSVALLVCRYKLVKTHYDNHKSIATQLTTST